MVYDSKRFYYDRSLVEAIYFPENRCSCRVLAVSNTLYDRFLTQDESGVATEKIITPQLQGII